VNNGQETRSTRTSFNSLYHFPEGSEGERETLNTEHNRAPLFSLALPPFFFTFSLSVLFLSRVSSSRLLLDVRDLMRFFFFSLPSLVFFFFFFCERRMLVRYFSDVCPLFLAVDTSFSFRSVLFLFFFSSLFVPFKKIPERKYCNCREQGRSDALEDRR